MTTFARRHYEAIAQVIRGCPIWAGGNEVETEHSVQQMEFLISNLADMFQSDNPGFDRKRFLKACANE